VNYIVLAIENVKGGTLGDLIKKRSTDNQPLTEEECSKAIKGILLGLKHIHS
jgi:serine/threonine protein kinase